MTDTDVDPFLPLHHSYVWGEVEEGGRSRYSPGSYAMKFLFEVPDPKKVSPMLYQVHRGFSHHIRGGSLYWNCVARIRSYNDGQHNQGPSLVRG